MEWRVIPNCSYIYEISELGEIRKVLTGNGYKYLKKYNHSRGYLAVSLKKDTGWKSCLIHRLVAESFIPNMENKKQVNHKDGDKRNNHYSNLEWVTNQENRDHAVDLNLIATGSKAGSSKLIEQDVLDIIKEWNNGSSQSVIAKKYNVNRQNINRILNRKRWIKFTKDIYIDTSRLVPQRSNSKAITWKADL